MISNIFLISRTSGVCIIHKSYSAKKQDESIISGYLTALNDFSQEIGGKTKELKMENSRLKYKFVDDEALFVFVVEETEDKSIKEEIDKAIEEIIIKYKEKFPEGIKFAGNTEIYNHSIGVEILDKTVYPLAFRIGALNRIIEGRLNSIQFRDYSQIKSDVPFDLDNLEL
ncbi:MAG: hypothetical protein ACTSRP_08220 [Candidatus Helarchaeota archaeon]